MNIRVLCITYLALVKFWLLMHPAQGQHDNQSGKKAPERRKANKETALKTEEFELEDSTFFYDETQINFRNINQKPFYYNERLLGRINKYQQEKNWEQLFRYLLNYVSRLGPGNFTEPSSAEYVAHMQQFKSALNRSIALPPSGIDLIWQLARVALQMRKMEIAKEALQLIIKHHRGNLARAWKHYDSLFPFEKPRYVTLEEYYQMLELRKHIDTLRPPRGILTDIGQAINSDYDDYGVSLSRNGNMLIFTSKRNRSPSSNPLRQIFNEDLFIAERIGEDTAYWQDAYPFADLNTAYNEGSPCLSAKGDFIIFARCEAPDGMGNCDLYISRRVQGRYWSEPENLGIVNSPAWDSHPALSVTEDTLYFSSDRAGGFGGADLYFSVRDATGKWGPAQNLGPIINTQKNEVSPFIHHKYNVLYFSSDGHLVNYGDFDIFKSYYIKGRWTEPKNLGPLVNSAGREFYFTIDTNSDKLFFAKAQEGNSRNLDIYSYPMPMEAKPNAVVRFKGQVKEASTGQIVKGIVSVIDLTDGVEVMPKYLSEQGEFEFELINQKRYMLVVQGENFFRLEEIFFLQGDTERQYSVKSIDNVRFESIEFAEGSAEILPEMENDLHLVMNFLIDYPEFMLSISGHTDSSGNPENNLKLSQRRAEAIKNYLVTYGKIDPNRIIAVGYGNTKPIISPELTAEHRKINRRVEFKIYKPNNLTEDKTDK
ncbi:MAG: OmpA family protein [Cytophagales bacterium]|nr:OmpA family protein [Bernardetiaceae bacterium]MDW8210651.1 OmpA family protein [Cytophagales bacterium]